MHLLRFDHFLTFIDARDVDEHLACYRQAGFVDTGRTVRLDPGLRNGAVLFGTEYIEFCWVEDEQLFIEESKGQHVFGADLFALRAVHRPCSIGLITDDVTALREQWTARGYSLALISPKAPRGVEPGTQRGWSFFNIPDALTPGAKCFALTYAKRDTSSVRIAPNTIYAVDGVTFVSLAPEEYAHRWQELLVPGVPIVYEEDGCSVTIEPHLAQWITPDRYQQDFGRVWQASPHPFGALAVLHLLAEDLDRVAEMLRQAAWSLTWRPNAQEGQKRTLLVTNPADGYLFSITTKPYAEWLNARTTRTGELLERVDA